MVTVPNWITQITFDEENKLLLSSSLSNSLHPTFTCYSSDNLFEYRQGNQNIRTNILRSFLQAFLKKFVTILYLKLGQNHTHRHRFPLIVH
jgi:hypothetical protein